MSLKRGKTDSTLLDCCGSRTMLRRKSNVSFIFFLTVSSSAVCLISAMASLHSSSLRTVSGKNWVSRLATGPPSPSSQDAPSDDAKSCSELNHTNYPFFSVMSAASMFTIFLLVSSVRDLLRLYSFMRSPPGLGKNGFHQLQTKRKQFSMLRIHHINTILIQIQDNIFINEKGFYLGSRYLST